MTRSHSKNGADVVTLSKRDWGVLFAAVFPVLVLIILGWLRHDRLLTTLIVQQDSIADRVERVEETLDLGRQLP